MLLVILSAAKDLLYMVFNRKGKIRFFANGSE
jgi:hypothetical protein